MSRRRYFEEQRSGSGSAGSSSYTQDGASDGGDTNGEEYGIIKGQGHTTRDFGESGGKRKDLGWKRRIF